jgi:putative inorganic carbon (HCO3(-)) transporter
MSYTAFLRWTLIIGLCAIPFIAFIIAGSNGVPAMFFPYITGKNFIFRILVELLLLAYIVLAVKEPAYRPKASHIMWAVGAFVLWMAFATILSVDPIKSFWSNFERMDGYITVIHLLALFIVAGAVLTANKWWDNFFRVSIAVGAIQGIYALLQVFNLFGLAPSSQSGVRADTTFGNATYLAVFMLFNIFFTFYMMARDRRSSTMLTLYGMALLLELPALYYTETRGALLGLVGGFIVAALYMAVRTREMEYKNLRRASWIALGAVAVLVVAFLMVKDTAFVRNSPGLGRLASISLQDSTTQARLFYIWPTAIQGALERPVAGWGQENFNFIFNEHYNPAMYAQEQWFDRAHNEFLDWLVAGGVPAFLLYLSLFLLAAWAIVRSQELSTPEQGILLGLLAAYAFNNLFVFDNLMSIAYFFLLLAYLHGLSWRVLPRYMLWLKPTSDHTVAVVAPIVAIVVLSGAWMLNSSGMARAQSIITALQSTDPATGVARPIDKSFAAFKAVFDGGALGRQEAVEQLFQFAGAVQASASASPELKQDVYTFTRQQGDAMLAERKNDARLELFESIFLSQYGKYDDALKHLENAAILSPGKQQVLFQEGQTYLQKGDTASALADYKKAYDLAPDYDQAIFYYAGALYSTHQDAQADALLIKHFGTTTVDNDQLVQIYSSTKQYAKLIAIWEARAAKSPNDENVHVQLASAYFSSGNTAKAISELEIVAKLNPAAAGQVQALISQIKSGALTPGQ